MDPTPPPPQFHRIGGGGVPMLVLHHLNPLILGTRYTHYIEYWLPMQITKYTPFPIFFSESLPETMPKQYKQYPFPKKMGTHMPHPYAFKWGGGGGIDLPTHHVALASIWAVLFMMYSNSSSSLTMARSPSFVSSHPLLPEGHHSP